MAWRLAFPASPSAAPPEPQAAHTATKPWCSLMPPDLCAHTSLFPAHLSLTRAPDQYLISCKSRPIYHSCVSSYDCPESKSDAPALCRPTTFYAHLPHCTPITLLVYNNDPGGWSCLPLDSKAGNTFFNGRELFYLSSCHSIQPHTEQYY